MSKSSKYKSLAEWREANPKNYNIAVNRGWLSKLCTDMGWERRKVTKPPNHWNNKENVLASAMKYETRSKWSKGESAAYVSAKRNGWFDEAVSGMKIINNPNNYWTKEMVMEEAKKFMVAKDWKKHSNKSYEYARRAGWYKEAKAHMVAGCTPKGYWTKERVMEDARKYKSRYEWQLASPRANAAAFRHGWNEEAMAHMKELIKPAGYWVKDKVLASARKYSAKMKWHKGELGAVQSAKNNGWYEEATAHMKKSKYVKNGK